MRQQIARDAGQPVGAEGIEPCLLDGVEQGRGLGILRLVGPMNLGVGESTLQDDAIGKCAKAAVRGSVGLSEHGISVIHVAQRSSAGGDGTCVAMIR